MTQDNVIEHLCMYICDPFCQNEILLCTWSKLSSWYIIKVYIPPFISIMVVEILKSDNPKRSYVHLTFGVLKSIEWRNWLLKFGVYHCVNCQLVQKSSKFHHLGFKFLSKPFTVQLKHKNNYDFAKISKSKKITPTHIFSHMSIWGLAQKRLISIEWITYNNECAVNASSHWHHKFILMNL